MLGIMGKFFRHEGAQCGKPASRKVTSRVSHYNVKSVAYNTPITNNPTPKPYKAPAVVGWRWGWGHHGSYLQRYRRFTTTYTAAQTYTSTTVWQ
jgi:hypothetical protein